MPWEKRRYGGSYCCIPECRTSSANKEKVFLIPTLQGKRRGVKTKEWASNFHQVVFRYRFDAKFKKRVLDGKAYVCSKHFKPSDIIQTSHQSHLQIGSLPTLNLPTKSHQFEGPEERTEVMEHNLPGPKIEIFPERSYQHSLNSSASEINTQAKVHMVGEPISIKTEILAEHPEDGFPGGHFVSATANTREELADGINTSSLKTEAAMESLIADDGLTACPKIEILPERNLQHSLNNSTLKINTQAKNLVVGEHVMVKPEIIEELQEDDVSGDCFASAISNTREERADGINPPSSENAAAMESLVAEDDLMASSLSLGAMSSTPVNWSATADTNDMVVRPQTMIVSAAKTAQQPISTAGKRLIVATQPVQAVRREGASGPIVTKFLVKRRTTAAVAVLKSPIVFTKGKGLPLSSEKSNSLKSGNTWPSSIKGPKTGEIDSTRMLNGGLEDPAGKNFIRQQISAHRQVENCGQPQVSNGQGQVLQKLQVTPGFPSIQDSHAVKLQRVQLLPPASNVEQPTITSNQETAEESSDILGVTTENEYVANSDLSDMSSDGLPLKVALRRAKVKKTKRQRDSDFKTNKTKPKRPCLFCSKFQSKLVRHICTIHKNEPRVAQALSLSKEQQAYEFSSMRKEAIYLHNLNSIKEGKSTMICERATKQNDLKICTQCKAFIRRRYFYSHSRNCRKSIEVGSTSAMPLEYLMEESESGLFADLLTRFNDDRPGKLCKTNLTLRTIGKSQFEKLRRKKSTVPEIRKAVMTKMRMLSNLYLEFLACAKQTLTVKDMFVRKYFSLLEEAIHKLTSREDGSLKPGLKLAVGNLLKTSCKVLKGTYLINDEDEMAESVDHFNAVLLSKWASIFGDAKDERVHNLQSNLRQPNKLPNEDDVKKVRNYTIGKLKTLLEDPYLKVSVDLFIPIRDLTLSRLTLFNARRGGELSRLRIQDWIEAKEDKWVNNQRALPQNVTRVDEMLLKTFKVIMFQGETRTSHLVPVFVPPDCIAALDYLQDKSIRKDNQVHENNKYLFPSTKFSLDHAIGCHSVSRITHDAEVGSAITATKMRHRALYASLDVPDDQRKAFYGHMGHSADVNKNGHQYLSGIQEVTVVGQYFASIDELKITNDLDSGQMNLSRSECASDVQDHDNEIEGNAEKNPNCADLEESQNMEIDESAGRKKRRRYVRWTSHDASILCEYFKDVIQNTTQKENQGSLPGFSEIRKFLEENFVMSAVSDEKEKIKIVHTKLFNERKKFRDRYFKTLKVLD